MKNPTGSALFSSDKRYLHEICKKYNAASNPDDKIMADTKQKIEGTTAAMKNNMILMMGNQDQAKVCFEIIKEKIAIRR